MIGIGLTDKRMRTLGVQIWTRHHIQLQGMCCDIERFEHMTAVFINPANVDKSLPIAERYPHDVLKACALGIGLYHWIDSGAQSVSLAPRFASALMNTSAGQDVGDIRVPWRSFSIQIPPGVLFRDGAIYGTEDLPVERLYVRRVDRTHDIDDAPFISVLFSDVQMNKYGVLELDHQGRLDDFYQQRQLVDLVTSIRRIIVGVTFYLSTHHSDSLREPGRTKPHRERGDPWHRVIHLAPTVSVDCSVNPSDTPRHTSSKPGDHVGYSLQFQSLTRGHWRRFPGAPAEDKRRIWIQPYWRGPEDAAILTRNRHLTDEVPVKEQRP